MLQISPTNAYKRDFKKIATELVGSTEYVEVMYLLINQLPLSEKYQDHPLNGEWIGFRDCHIKPDLVLIYMVEEDILRLVRLGSHSELFG